MENPIDISLAAGAAADFFVESGRAPNFEELAGLTGIDQAKLHSEFGTVDAPLVRYYAGLVVRCEETVAELQPPNVEERIGAFSFVMLDLLEERSAFTHATFSGLAGQLGSPFRAALGSALGRLLDSDDVPAVNSVLLIAAPVRFVTVEAFLRLLNSWLEDDSEDRQRSTALLDKTVRFYSEIASNQTANKGVDVVRYAVEAGYLPRIPFVSDWLFGREHSDDESQEAGKPAPADA
ncbi:MAG: hypothetical protein ACI80V_001021 [Rhodothermales bacterium]|jgi:hypothetical protein